MSEPVPPHFDRLAYPISSRFTMWGRRDWMHRLLGSWARVGVANGDRLTVDPA